jgi:hypothetical protein
MAFAPELNDIERDWKTLKVVCFPQSRKGIMAPLGVQ